MLLAQNKAASDQHDLPETESAAEVAPEGVLRAIVGKNGVRIATLSRIFVVFLVLMTFGIVAITLMNVGSGRDVVDQWQEFDQQNVIKQSIADRLDMAELVNSFQMFQKRPDEETADIVISNIEETERAIQGYKATQTNSSEEQSLAIIGKSMVSYRSAVEKIREAEKYGFSTIEVSQQIIDETYEAIIAIKLLNAEHEHQRDDGFASMRSSVDDMMSVLYRIAVTSSIAAAVIGVLIWWLSARLLISPLMALRSGMIKLAAGNTEVEMRPDEMLSDIREMTASVEVFRRNLIDAERLRREEKEAQQRIRILSHAIEQSPASVVLVDPDERIQYFNPRFGDLVGYSPEEITGQKFDQILDPEGADNEASRIWSGAAETGGWSGEVSSRTKSGERIWTHLVVSPVREEGEDISHFLVVMEDISQRKEFESRLIEAKETAEVAYRAKTEFLANMTHELRTPLNAIIGFSEIIKSELLGPIGLPSYLDYSNDIHESGTHLLGLIEDILDYSRIEAGKQVLVETDIDLVSAIRSSRNVVADRARSEEISIRLDVPDQPLLMRADERKVRQILLNLLSNAVKFSHKDSEIVVGVHIELDLGISVFVRDQGIGISGEDIATALAPFGQVDSSLNREYEGTGLGLPLSKTLAEAHGGSLLIESERDVGTTVTVTFPVDRNIQAFSDPESNCA